MLLQFLLLTRSAVFALARQRCPLLVHGTARTTKTHQREPSRLPEHHAMQLQLEGGNYEPLAVDSNDLYRHSGGA